MFSTPSAAMTMSHEVGHALDQGEGAAFGDQGVGHVHAETADLAHGEGDLLRGSLHIASVVGLDGDGEGGVRDGGGEEIHREFAAGGNRVVRGVRHHKLLAAIGDAATRLDIAVMGLVRFEGDGLDHVAGRHPLQGHLVEGGHPMHLEQEGGILGATVLDDLVGDEGVGGGIERVHAGLLLGRDERIVAGGADRPAISGRIRDASRRGVTRESDIKSGGFAVVGHLHRRDRPFRGLFGVRGLFVHVHPLLVTVDPFIGDEAILLGGDGRAGLARLFGGEDDGMGQAGRVDRNLFLILATGEDEGGRHRAKRQKLFVHGNQRLIVLFIIDDRVGIAGLAGPLQECRLVPDLQEFDLGRLIKAFCEHSSVH